MIERIRKRFIHSTIASVLVALVLIMGAFNYMAFRNVRQNADMLLTLMAENGGDFPDRIPDEYKGIIGDVSDAAAIIGGDDNRSTLNADSGIGRTVNSGSIQSDRYFSRVTDETPYETRYFSVILSAEGTTMAVNTGRIASVTSEQAVEYAKALRNIGSSFPGYLGTYRYRIQQVPNGTMYLFLDCTSGLYNAIYIFLLSLMIGVAALILISMLVILFSKKAIKPIAESYEKQQKFITNAGHELKTPLAIIDSCTEVLEMTDGENKWTSGIHEQVNRLSTMTAELISMAKMAESDLELNKRDLDLSELCRETWEPFGLLAEEQGFDYQLDITPDIPFFGNEQTLKQLCSILADNAIKYAVPGTTIILSLKKKGRRVNLSSNNAAENVKKGNRSEFFERFYRGDTSHSSEKKGYGIGLSMAETITELHHGRISASSDDGERLTIMASFPERGGSARNIRKTTKQQEKAMKKSAKEQGKTPSKA